MNKKMWEYPMSNSKQKGDKMVDKILQAINLASYDYKPEDELNVKLSYLLELRKEILNQRDEINRLKKEVNFQSAQNKVLTGKLIECSLERKSIDTYM